MKIIAVILNYNSWNNTIRLIDNLRRTNNNLDEIVVVDNNSSDESFEMLYERTDITLLSTKKNLGFAGGNNVGIRRAVEDGADFVFVLNPDILFKNAVIPLLVQNMIDDEKIAVVSPKMVQKSGEVSVGIRVNIGKLNLISPIADNQSKCLKLNYVDSVVGACMLVRVSAIEKVGLLPEAYFLNFEETEWNTKFIRNGFKVCVNRECSIFHEVHGSINKVSGLEDYYIRRNAVVFTMRMGTHFEISQYLFVAGVRTLISSIHHRDLSRIRAFTDGMFRLDKYGHYVSNAPKVRL